MINNIKQIIEIIGYIGSALVIVSMLMTSVVKLRVINTIGSVIFCTYALCIHSYPTAAMQVALIIINLINLHKLLNTKKEYSVVKLTGADSFPKYFLEQNNDDIKKIFPDFDQIKSDDSVYLICCHSDCAGILVGTPAPENALNVSLDYTTPAYRDTSVGKFLYNKLKDDNIKKLTARTGIELHQKYLLKMGFAANGDCFEKQL
ncbi:MAG: YgjV family protein [Treponema sp.]|nr:YgjV family protein [Treponema sp.]